MGREGCDRLADLLVDYADGELPEPDRRRVADHLASCADCQAERELLGRSLDLARSVWQEAVAERPAAPFRRRGPARLMVAAAACAVVVLVAVGSWLAWRPRGCGETASVQQAGAPGGREESAVKPSPAGETAPEEDLDVEAILAREQRAARLAATVALLATEPSLKEYKDRAERYLQETYPEAAFGRPAQPSGKLPIKEPKS